MQADDDCRPLVWRTTPNYIPELEDYEVPEDWWRNGYSPLEGKNAADEATKYSNEHCKIPAPKKKVIVEPRPHPVIIERPRPVIIEPRPIVEVSHRPIVIPKMNVTRPVIAAKLNTTKIFDTDVVTKEKGGVISHRMPSSHKGLAHPTRKVVEAPAQTISRPTATVGHKVVSKGGPREVTAPHGIIRTRLGGKASSSTVTSSDHKVF